MATKQEMQKRIDELEIEKDGLLRQLNQGKEIKLEEQNVTISIKGKVVRLRLDDDEESINFNTSEYVPFFAPVSTNRVKIKLLKTL